jgi:hypothetical protein
VPRRDAQLIGDLTKRQPKSAKAMHRSQTVKATVPLGVRVELINERKLAIPPGSGFWKDSFDKRPRPFQLLVREPLRSRPTSPRPSIPPKVLSVEYRNLERCSRCYVVSGLTRQASSCMFAIESPGSCQASKAGGPRNGADGRG